MSHRSPSAVFCVFAVFVAVLSAGCATPEPAPDYVAIVRAQNRTDADRANDQRREPEKLLAFYDVRPGMKVLDLGASSGYNTELLARVVGPSGRVYAQNSPFMLENFVKGRLDERVKQSGLGNVVSVARDFDDPIPSDVRGLDLVTFMFVYHDTPSMGVDRSRMNRAVFDALKPGGVYIIGDHSALAGSGVNGSKSLHRIEESVVRKEVEAAGFRLVSSADFLRNPADPRNVQVQKNPVRNDEFLLKFVKP